MAKTLSSQCRGAVGKLLEGFIGAEVYLGEPGASQGKPLILTKSCGYSSHFADGQVKTQSRSQSLVGRQSLMYQLCFLKNIYGGGWVFIAVHGLSRGSVSRGCPLAAVPGLLNAAGCRVHTQ